MTVTNAHVSSDMNAKVIPADATLLNGIFVVITKINAVVAQFMYIIKLKAV